MTVKSALPYPALSVITKDGENSKGTPDELRAYPVLGVPDISTGTLGVLPSVMLNSQCPETNSAGGQRLRLAA